MPNHIIVPLSRGKFALIDEEDADRVLTHKWCAVCPDPRSKVPVWYGSGKDEHAKNRYLHRFILSAPQGTEVDHINGDGLDCRRVNLRLATRAQNAANRETERGASGFRGVYRDDGRWTACVESKTKRYRMYGFKSPEDAARAYDDMARKYHGEFARLNFPA